MTGRIRVLVADDSPTARQLLAALVSGDRDDQADGRAQGAVVAAGAADQVRSLDDIVQLLEQLARRRGRSAG